MERYYKPSTKVSKRSEKNKNLYYDKNEIDEIKTYSNIEAVAPLDKTNEIDITKIKKMLKSREDYKRQREYQSHFEKRKQMEEPIHEVQPERIRNYDIKEELEKISTTNTGPSYRTLDDTSYQVLKQLKIKKENQSREIPNDEEKEEQTLVNTRMLKNLNDEQLSLNMFEDLASSKTIGNNRTSITSLLEEAKKIDEKNQKEKEEKKIDNSFYTSSLNMDRKDFEGLYDKSNFTISSDKKMKMMLIGIPCAIALLILLFFLFR